MTSFVRLPMPGALLFFISFRVFLAADIEIGGAFDESGLVFFLKRSVGLGVYNCIVLCKSMRRSLLAGFQLP